MELLATVHRVMHHGANVEDLDDVFTKVQAWNPRKRAKIKEGHVRAAWSRLRQQGWTPLAAPIAAIT